MPAPRNSQTHSNNSSDVANELFKYVQPFYEVGAYRVNIILGYKRNPDKVYQV